MSTITKGSKTHLASWFLDQFSQLHQKIIQPVMRSFIFFLGISLLLLYVSFFCVVSSSATDSITPNQLIKDPDSLVSNNSFYKLGFFSPNGSTHRYVGIWFNDASPINVFWVANRENPLTGSSGVFKVSEDGNLVVLNGQNEVLWSSNIWNSTGNVTARLLDTGNLVLKDEGSVNGGNLWESFENPSDSMLPRMKVSTNLRTRANISLTAWRSPSNPSYGSFSAFLDPLSIPEIYVWNNSSPYWRSGPWNGQVFIGVRSMNYVYLDGFNVVSENDGTSYLTLSFADETFLTSFVLRSDGVIVQIYVDNSTEAWVELWTSHESDCDAYGKCGAFGSCNAQSKPICSCLRGFQPKSIEEWNSGDWTSGCIRRKPLQCERNSSSDGAEGKPDGFLRLSRTKVPDNADWNADWSSHSESGCRTQCMENCTCNAYAYDNGIGCMTWSGNLTDVQIFSETGSDLYIRVAYSELDEKVNVKLIISISVIVGLLAVSAVSFFIWRCIAKQRAAQKQFYKVKDDGHHNFIGDDPFGDEIEPHNLQELPLFNFDILASATNNFDAASKLGQGGFGPVYKGSLPSGKLIAVKRLSRVSGQGLEEFMNEVLVISKLQHRNLVRLYGCCTEGEEKMLIYEYLPNKSLDTCLFDPIKKKLLLWGKRFEIIRGIGRGILYLHRDSRLRIIHRDLKASNILLDDELYPKISDFGMARIFGSNQDQGNTTRVVGTYGYMSPEYVIHGRFSEKSDIFSFGVLLLEIVSGRRNTSFYHDEHSLSLLGHTWKLWRNGKFEEVIDPIVFEPSLREEMMRCIQIGLLCVQENAADRPSASTALSMLSSEIQVLPSPKQPAFSEIQSPIDMPQLSPVCFSANEVTLTSLQGR